MAAATTAPFPPGSGSPISRVNYGAMGFHAFYTTEPPAQEDFNRFMDDLVAKSPSPVMVDTSDIYTLNPGKGDNERAIGNWLKASGKRDRVFLATKFAMTPTMGLACSREDALKACDASLERLGVDYVDLYYNHRPDRSLGVESTFQGLKELKEAGKTRFVGCSEYNLEELKTANAIVHVDAYQVEASPWTPEVFSNGLSDWCRQNGTALVAYSPLGRGMAGRFKSRDDVPEGDFRRRMDRFFEDNFEANAKLNERIGAVAQARGATSAQVCLAWLLAQGEHVFPIPGTTNASRLEENVGALKLQLSGAEVAQIDDMVRSFETVGKRYPEAMLKGVAF